MSSQSRDTSDVQEQHRRQHGEHQPAKTGEGSGSAMAAMVKKRREGENHPEDDAPEDGPGN